MTERTRSILDLITTNGFAVKVDSFNLETLVSIVLPGRCAEHLYSFNALNEGRVATRIAEAFCSAEQIDTLDGIDLHRVANRCLLQA